MIVIILRSFIDSQDYPDSTIINIHNVHRNNFDRLHDLFEDPFYNVVDLLCTNEEQYVEALRYCSHNYPKDNCLLIRDNSTTNLDAISLKREIERGLTAMEDHNSDMLFLTSWSDYCCKLFPISMDDPRQNLMWSVHPSSTQAVIYSPYSIQYILENIQLGYGVGDFINSVLSSEKPKMNAMVYYPNLIFFDISLATSNDDYSKLNGSSPPEPINQSSSESNISILIIAAIIIAIIIIIILYYIFR